MIKSRFNLILLCLILSIFAVGCNKAENDVSLPSEPPVTESAEIIKEPEIINAAEVYNAAIAKLNESQNLSFEFEVSSDVKISNQHFWEKISGTVSISRNETGYEYYSFETLYYGDEKSIIEEYYSENLVRIVVDGEHKFYSICANPDERCLPAVLIDPSLYSNVEAVEEGEMINLYFSSPSAAEIWSVSDDTDFIDAQGRVLVNADGSIAEMRYYLRYRDLISEHEVEFVSRPSVSAEPFFVPEIGADYVFIDFADAPYFSIRAEGLALQSTALSFSNSVSVGLHAASMHDYIVSNVDVYGSGENYSFSDEYNATAFFGMGDETASREVYKNYKNGFYRDSSTQNEWIDMETKVAANHVESIFREASVPYEFWESANGENLGGVLLIKFRLSELFAEEALSFISDEYYQDPEHISKWSSEINSEDSYAYISVDLSTGLPLSRGFYQLGNHNLTDRADNFSTQYFELEINQTIDCCSEQAYYDINKVYKTSDDPSNVNPLLYRVSGRDGEQMWILCGTSVGSQNDVYPRQLYTLVDDCDNIMILIPAGREENRRYATDSNFAAEISSVQSYGNGTLLERLGEELFEEVSAHMLINAVAFHDYTNLKAISAYDAMSLAGNSLVNLDTYYSTDELFADYASRNGINVLSAGDTLKLLKIRNNLSDETAIRCINDYLLAGVRTNAEVSLDFHDVWKSGDEGRLYELCNVSYSADNPVEKELAEESGLYDEILKDAVLRQLRSRECTFVIAEAYMLYNSSSGLMSSLKEAGYSIEKVLIE